MLAAGTLLSQGALAGGLFGYEIGTADVGLASAGYGARAQDPSTVYTNVAGMTRLDGQQWEAALEGVYSNVKVSPATVGPGLGTDDGGNAISFFPNGSAFYTYSYSQDLKLGIGIAGNFGGVVKYNDGWMGRYYTKESTLEGGSILPSIAYRVDDKWSVGLSLNVQPMILDQKSAINIIGGADGQVEIKHTTVGYGGNVGVLYELSPATRVGLTYNSEVRLTFTDQPTFTGLTGPLANTLRALGLTSKPVDIHENVPQQVMLGGFHQLNDKVALMGNLGWQNWTQFGAVEINIDSTNPRSLSTTIPYKNTWHEAVGVQYKLNTPWTINAGLAYDSAFQQGAVSPSLPTNAALRIGVGAEQALSGKLVWGFCGEYLNGGSPDVNQQGVRATLGGRGSFSGSYNSEYMVFLSAYVRSSF